MLYSVCASFRFVTRTVKNTLVHGLHLVLIILQDYHF